VVTGDILAGFGLGSQELYDFCSEGRAQFALISVVNNPYEIGKKDSFISINACLMADLTGQVCSESLGHYQYSTIGGQLDFAKGAALSRGGRSFLCLPSTTKCKDGKVSSTITLNLPSGAVVTTPRAEVMYIVTEFGAAFLQNKPIRERVNAMIRIAHPNLGRSFGSRQSKRDSL
jgi:acyl-CoA hydrolase